MSTPAAPAPSTPALITAFFQPDSNGPLLSPSHGRGYLRPIGASGTMVGGSPATPLPAGVTSTHTGTSLAAIAADLGLTTADINVARKVKLAALATSLAASLAAGVNVSGGGLTALLAADPVSQAKFTGLLTLWQAAETNAYNAAYAAPGNLSSDAAGQAATLAVDAQAFTIFDAHGAPVTGTIGTVRALLVAYGQAIAALEIATLGKVNAVNSASTVAAVNAVA